MHKFTEEEKEFLRAFVPGHSYREIMERFREIFKWDISMVQVAAAINRYKLNTGRSGQFKKGQPAHNKGKKMDPDVYERVKHTMFKKGNIPKNYRPVGSERVTVDGYVEIKYADPNKWMLKHKYIWEQHYGKIPMGHALIFLDGDSTNVDISNLKLVTRNELLIMNRFKIRGETPELMETAANLAKLISQTNIMENGIHER